MIDHRPNVVSEVDLLLVMREGRMQAFGPSEEILKRLKRPLSAVPSRTILSEVG
jgi:ABC-type protease/lipase transport system fused ATPase/permease subunit